MSSVFKLFFDTSSGTTLSMLICKCSKPASFKVPIRSLLSKNPFVIIPAIIPRFRMCRITPSNSGCISGSPPLIVMIDVPKPAKISRRFFISTSGTGFDTLSYSLQYPQSKLHRRIGMMCTKIGCFVDASALAIIFSSRTRVRRNRRRRSRSTSALAFTVFVSSGMNSANSPRLQLYTTPHQSLFPASWLTPALFPIAQLGAHSSPLYSTLDRNGSTAADLTRASHKACYSLNHDAQLQKACYVAHPLVTCVGCWHPCCGFPIQTQSSQLLD